jgi:hypothetical protein
MYMGRVMLRYAEVCLCVKAFEVVLLSVVPAAAWTHPPARAKQVWPWLHHDGTAVSFDARADHHVGTSQSRNTGAQHGRAALQGAGAVLGTSFSSTLSTPHVQ